jgi:hypothetical protein
MFSALHRGSGLSHTQARNLWEIPGFRRKVVPGLEVETANEAPIPLQEPATSVRFRRRQPDELRWRHSKTIAALKTNCTAMRPVFLVKQLAKRLCHAYWRPHSARW